MGHEGTGSVTQHLHMYADVPPFTAHIWSRIRY